ncbi:cryptochrome DASH-like isoform X1 [Penaeus chinensis]|uniref:cryptochrome DASH-like isoform X1 n=2 Tax=Penaeus chinensis TaxID=139456 RepID=UPI001FB7DD57|nr:cryptochrome DASH-like isoform X1 [Penaeus chinensis]
MISCSRSVGGRVLKLQRNNFHQNVTKLREVSSGKVTPGKMASTNKSVAFCWLRNDLRYHDNEVLTKANINADYVVPVYCFDPRHFKGTYHFEFPKTGPHRAKFLKESVEDLKATLRNRGSDLIVRLGKPEEVLPFLIKSVAATTSHLVFQEEVTKEETDVERSVRDRCKDAGVNVHSFWGATLYHKTDLPFPINKVPDTYTNFRKAVEAQSRVRGVCNMPDKLKPLPENLDVGEIPTLSKLGVEELPMDNRTAFPFAGGETAGLARVKNYFWDTNNVANYKETRNGLLGEAYSTKLSPWLAHGCLSPRFIFNEIKKYESQRVANKSTYWVIFEMIWRDYFRFVCMKFGDRVFYPSGIMGKKVQWKRNAQLFEMWKNGRTGVPFVDANMRELKETGWMSNRGRQNVASFLLKDMGLDWRLGAEWFESQLLDHDVCSNYGNWNYAAGIGNDPRENRKFNMVKQGLDYDPEGNFIRVWVPELKNIKNGRIHTPWKMNIAELTNAGVSLGEDYPKPVVIAPEWGRHDHKMNNSNKKQKGGWVPPGQKRGIDFYFSGDRK